MTTRISGRKARAARRRARSIRTAVTSHARIIAGLARAAFWAIKALRALAEAAGL